MLCRDANRWRSIGRGRRAHAVPLEAADTHRYTQCNTTHSTRARDKLPPQGSSTLHHLASHHQHSQSNTQAQSRHLAHDHLARHRDAHHKATRHMHARGDKPALLDASTNPCEPPIPPAAAAHGGGAAMDGARAAHGPPMGHRQKTTIAARPIAEHRILAVGTGGRGVPILRSHRSLTHKHARLTQEHRGVSAHSTRRRYDEHPISGEAATRSRERPMLSGHPR